MADDVGPFRTRGQARARARGDRRYDAPRSASGRRRAAALRPAPADWFDLRNMLLVARVVAAAALARAGEPRRPPARGFSRHLPEWRSARRSAAHGDRAAQPWAPRHQRRHERAARLEIWRGEAVEPAAGRRYDVPFEPGDPCSTALRWIRATAIPSLAIRYSCINANACKECMIALDGIPSTPVRRGSSRAR